MTISPKSDDHFLEVPCNVIWPERVTVHQLSLSCANSWVYSQIYHSVTIMMIILSTTHDTNHCIDIMPWSFITFLWPTVCQELHVTKESSVSKVPLFMMPLIITKSLQNEVSSEPYFNLLIWGILLQDGKGDSYLAEHTNHLSGVFCFSPKTSTKNFVVSLVKAHQRLFCLATRHSAL